MRTLPALMLSALSVLTGATVVGAEEPRFPQRRGAEAWQPSLPPCACRAMGRTWGIGNEICLETAEGKRMHVCAMQQNVTIWEPSARTCPES